MIKGDIYIWGSSGGRAWAMYSLALAAAVLSEGVSLEAPSRRERFPVRRIGRTTLGHELSELDVPSGPGMLFESNMRCSDSIHPSLLPKRALLCNWISNVRKCLDVGPDEALFVGRGCTGDYCKLDLVPGQSRCILESYGLRVDASDTAAKKTCGLDGEDYNWLISGQNSLWESEGCEPSLPAGVSWRNWVSCDHGKLGFHYGLNFTGSQLEMPPLDVPYMCTSSPSCSGEWDSKVICYSQGESVTLHYSESGCSGLFATGLVVWRAAALAGGAWALFWLLFL